MKQNYMKPSVKWQTIEEDSEILAASPSLSVDSVNKVPPDDALSKENTSFSSHSLWDEDE